MLKAGPAVVAVAAVPQQRQEAEAAELWEAAAVVPRVAEEAEAAVP